jgi:hypothetical protein
VTSEQKIVDLTFSIAIAMQMNRRWFKGKSNEEVATWVAEKLRSCGIDTQPMGASWGVLK